jgi:pyruvate/2-oxoglutarate dehydrogenase complex dihydrolipoamide acyltransferase (E2) component
MAHEFTMPKLGLTMTDGTIREWLVADGTKVNAGDALLVIETDKVETEVEAREPGVLSISGVVGENYECGAVIGQLLGDGEAASQAASLVEQAPASAAAKQAAAAPAPEVSLVSAAASVVADDVATRGERDRILASPMARAAARNAGLELSHITGTGPGGRIVADDVVTRVHTLAAQPAAVSGASSGAVAATGEGGRVLASPMARAAARDRNVDLRAVVGTGPGGRIVAADVARFADSPVPALVTAAPAIAATVPEALPASTSVAATGGGRMLAELLGIDLRLVPASAGVRVTREDVAGYVRALLAAKQAPAAAAPVVESPEAPPEVPLLQEPSTMVPLRGMRGVIAERMHSSLTEMAQLTLSVDADMTAVNTERARLKQASEPVPGYTAWVIAAASRALVDHPYANSQVTAGGVAYLPQVNLGVAVSLDDGLIVPVIEQADTCSAYDLHTSVADLAGRAREGKLKLNELEGGTFSVTALGMYGVDMFTPVINPPNSAILGVGRLRTETRWEDGVASPMTVMTLSLTWDHRAFDGAPAAEFAQSIVRYLENPAQLNA